MFYGWKYQHTRENVKKVGNREKYTTCVVDFVRQCVREITRLILLNHGDSTHNAVLLLMIFSRLFGAWFSDTFGILYCMCCTVHCEKLRRLYKFCFSKITHYSGWVLLFISNMNSRRITKYSRGMRRPPAQNDTPAIAVVLL